MTLTLKDRIRRNANINGDTELARLLSEVSEETFNRVVHVLFLGMQDKQVTAFRAHYGVGTPRLTAKEVARQFYPELSPATAEDKMKDLFYAILHPLRKEVLRKALAGTPFALEGGGRPVTVLQVSTRALNYLWSGRTYTIDDLLHRSQGGNAFWHTPGYGETVHNEIKTALVAHV